MRRSSEEVNKYGREKKLKYVVLLLLSNHKISTVVVVVESQYNCFIIYCSSYPSLKHHLFLLLLPALAGFPRSYL